MARTVGAAVGPFEGIWSGTVNGENRTNATLTLDVVDRDGIVRGTANIGALTLRACGFDAPIDASGSTVSATKVSSTSRHAEGSLFDFGLPSTSRYDSISIVGDVNNLGNRLTGSLVIHGGQTRIAGVWTPGCDVTLNIPPLPKM